MSGVQRDEEWEAVQSRIRQIADRIEASTPDEPARLRTVLDIAYAVSKDAASAVLNGMVAVIPTPLDGETYREYAARLREAVER